MKLSKEYADNIIILDPRTCDDIELKRIIRNLEVNEFPYDEEIKQDLLFDFRFELKTRS